MAASDSGGVLHDVIVCHSDDEHEKAEKFCADVKDNVQWASGEPVDIVTMEEFSHPGKTHIANHDDALTSAKYIFFSQVFFDERLGNFLGMVAMAEKQPFKFIRLYFEEKEYSRSVSMNSITGIKLDEDWSVPRISMKRLQKVFGHDKEKSEESHKEKPRDSHKEKTQDRPQKALPELSPSPTLAVENPSMSGAWFSHQSDDQQRAWSDLASELPLNVENPSMSGSWMPGDSGDQRPAVEDGKPTPARKAAPMGRVLPQQQKGMSTAERGGLASRDLEIDSSDSMLREGSSPQQHTDSAQNPGSSTRAKAAASAPTSRPGLSGGQPATSDATHLTDSASCPTAQSISNVQEATAQGSEATLEQDTEAIPGEDTEETAVKSMAELDISSQKRQEDIDRDSSDTDSEDQPLTQGKDSDYQKKQQHGSDLDTQKKQQPDNDWDTQKKQQHGGDLDTQKKQQHGGPWESKSCYVFKTLWLCSRAAEVCSGFSRS